MRVLLFILFVGFNAYSQYDFKTPLEEVRQDLGEKKPLHALKKLDPILIKKGEEIFFKGQTKRPDGTMTILQAPAFRCNHCHNVVQEDPDLSINDPEARLKFAKTNGLAFLPGTTMYGSVNRTSWFNGDYIKKYGKELIGPAHKDFRNAVQLCSKECSKGRALDSWELEAMLNYLWSLQYKLADLKLSLEDYEFLNASKINNKEKLKLLDSKYLKTSEATFVKPPSDFEAGYGMNGDPESGKVIFENSCLHCHKADSGITAKMPRFRDSRRTYKALYRLKNSYGVSRKGLFESDTIYMPNYTRERLSDKQLDDLKAFIKEKVLSP